MRASSSTPPIAQLDRRNRSRRPRALPSRPSVDLAGRAVALSIDVPAGWDAPLGAHHKEIGRWVAANEPMEHLMTRADARRRIEAVFEGAVHDVLNPFTLAEFRVVALQGDHDKPPALAVICDTVGQVELGWIEKTNALASTLKGSVAPVGWRAAAYKALVHTLGMVLPVFDYGTMIEELAAYYWDGETDDESARRSLVEYYGHDADAIILPSDVAAKRPDFMLAENVGPLKDMPRPLRARLCRLRAAYDALKPFGITGNAWYFDFHEVTEYAPEYEECAALPPMTLVPADAFGMELDEVGRMGMEMRFLDIAGLCPLTGPGVVEQWFASLRLGAELLSAAQALIEIDPTGERP